MNSQLIHQLFKIVNFINDIQDISGVNIDASADFGIINKISGNSFIAGVKLNSDELAFAIYNRAARISIGGAVWCCEINRNTA